VGFCHLTLRASKPLPPEYPREAKTLGDHLRTVRLTRGLLQREVAELLGVTTMTVNGWETGRKAPKVSYLPAILEFLGYDPFPGAKSLGERLRAARRRLGLTQVKLAKELGVNQSSVTKLETGGEVINLRVLAAMQEFLETELRQSEGTAGSGGSTVE
jgi:transcriptional regulator with XRE-family HTH domain